MLEYVDKMSVGMKTWQPQINITNIYKMVSYFKTQPTVCQCFPHDSAVLWEFYSKRGNMWWELSPFALSGGWTSSVDRRGFLLSGSGESGESLITSDSCSSLSSKPFSLQVEKKKTKKFSDHNKIHFAAYIRQSKHCSPLRVLPAFVLGFLAAVFLRLVFPILPLPPPLLPLLLLGRFAATGDDAVQHPLVSVCVSGVSFH